MFLIKVDKVKKYYGDRLILDIDKFELNEGDKIGLVGENGAGKTTLIKALIGKEDIESGNVFLTNSYAYISQSEDYLGQCNSSKVNRILNAPTEYKASLSGGEKVKLKVTKALEENKSLIIADEPTANLDSKSIEILESMLKAYSGGLLLVSHDRNFLDSLCNIIAEVENGKLKLYNGNYTVYLHLKEEGRKREKTEYNQYVSEKRRLNEVIIKKQRVRDKIKTTPKRMGNSEARRHKMGGQQNKRKLDNNIKSLKSKIEQLEVKEKPRESKEIRINIQDNLIIGSKNPIEVKGLNLYAENKLLIKNAIFKIKKGKKIALLGDNGSGKSSLLKFILKGDGENIKAVNNAVIGYFDQSQEILQGEKSILENIMENSSYSESFIRMNLDGFGFTGNDVFKKVEVLSGGEKVKVALCKIILSDNNILILDEPTNYLDIKSVESLEKALKNTDKTVLIVCHDRKFVSDICNYILAIENQKLREFNGTYDEYIEEKTRPKLEKAEKARKEEILVLENKLAKVISLISITKDEFEKEELDIEYTNLLNNLRQLKR